jgi:hypothetical protein
MNEVRVRNRSRDMEGSVDHSKEFNKPKSVKGFKK